MNSNPPPLATAFKKKASACLFGCLKVLAVAVVFLLTMFVVVFALAEPEPRVITIEEFIDTEPDSEEWNILGGYAYLPWAQVLTKIESDGASTRILLFPLIPKALVDSIERKDRDRDALLSEVDILALCADADLIYRVERLRGRSDAEIQVFLRSSGEYWIFPLEVKARVHGAEIEGVVEIFPGEAPVSFDPTTIVIDIRNKSKETPFMMIGMMVGMAIPIIIALGALVLRMIKSIPTEAQRQRSIRGLVSNAEAESEYYEDQESSDEGVDGSEEAEVPKS